jgi:hypothetical protein
MKTNLKRDYQIDCRENPEMLDTCIRELFLMGFKPYSSGKSIEEVIDYIGQFSVLRVFPDGGLEANTFPRKELPVVSWKELIDLLTDKPLSKTVPLTDEYKAVVTPKGIKVGCQNITFETFDILAAAVAEVRTANKQTN